MGIENKGCWEGDATAVAVGIENKGVEVRDTAENEPLGHGGGW